jgi:hypothetical protein
MTLPNKIWAEVTTFNLENYTYMHRKQFSNPMNLMGKSFLGSKCSVQEISHFLKMEFLLIHMMTN